MTQFTGIEIYIDDQAWSLGTADVRINNELAIGHGAGVESLLLQHEGKLLKSVIIKVQGEPDKLIDGGRITEDSAPQIAQQVTRYLAEMTKSKRRREAARGQA